MKTAIEMAREAGLFTHKEVQPELKRFAELVRADEREACAKMCDELFADLPPYTAPDCAFYIRARSNT